jgi:hypothetical protein
MTSRCEPKIETSSIDDANEMALQVLVVQSIIQGLTRPGTGTATKI